MSKSALLQENRSPGCNAALDVVWQYGTTDEAHHKQWVIDQMLRALLGNDYDAWIDSLMRDESGDVVYEWDTGIAP